MAEDSDQVTTLNRLLLDAARTDNVDQMDEVFAKVDKLDEVLAKHGTFDINFQDGIGNTALHYAALHGSPNALDKLLEYEGCDVDYVNLLEGATPLHLAVQIKEPELRAFIVDSLLDAGADTSIKDKSGSLAQEYVPNDDTETRNAFRRYQVQREVVPTDIAYDYDDDDDGDYSSESEEE